MSADSEETSKREAMNVKRKRLRQRKNYVKEQNHIKDMKSIEKEA